MSQTTEYRVIYLTSAGPDIVGEWETLLSPPPGGPYSRVEARKVSSGRRWVVSGSPSNPQKVECPSCAAPVGRICSSGSGRGGYHLERLAAVLGPEPGAEANHPETAPLVELTEAEAVRALENRNGMTYRGIVRSLKEQDGLVLARCSSVPEEPTR